MNREFERQIELLNFDSFTSVKILQLITEEGKEFPCLKCHLTSGCEKFKWFPEWFGL